MRASGRGGHCPSRAAWSGHHEERTRNHRSDQVGME